MSNLNLTPVVDVVVSLDKAASARGDFDRGLIIASGTALNGGSALITSSAEVLSLGFGEQSDAYRASRLYFSQTPKPATLLIAARGEKAALETVRAVEHDFYGVYVAHLADDEVMDLSAWALENRRVLFFDVQEKPEDLDASIFADLKAASMKNTFALYSETPFAAAGAMGLSMGMAKRTAGSAFALSYKTIAGVAGDPLTEAEVEAFKNVCANVYITRGGAFSGIERGVMADGSPYDEVMGLHRLSSDIQSAVMELLSNTRTKIPHTDAGMLQFITAINGELEKSRAYGFIAPGVWTGEDVLALETGDTLETGYLTQAEPVASQTRAERSARKAPAIYVCAKLAGAIEHVVIQVEIDR